jgi:protein-S-isoprenylcysteine O-methyltransferase Ste14
VPSPSTGSVFMVTPAPPHAGVRFPPPLLYVVALAVAGLLQHAWPLPITPGASAVRIAGAGACFLAFVALFGGAFAGFRRFHTTLIPNRPAATLVTAGPYRITRNPMYVSLVALYLGVTLLSNSWWPVVLLPILVLVVDRAVIAREERYLTAAFPVEYAAYCARVRRWL